MISLPLLLSKTTCAEVCVISMTILDRGVYVCVGVGVCVGVCVCVCGISMTIPCCCFGLQSEGTKLLLLHVFT